MKIYLASSFVLVEKVEKISKLLEENKFEVLCKWWTGLDYIPTEGKLLSDMRNEDIKEFYSHPATENAFNRDKKAIQECDVFIFVADDKIIPYNGANVEFGIAVANSKLCLSVGKLKNSAMYYPLIQLDTIPELLTTLTIIRDNAKEGKVKQNKKLISMIATDLVYREYLHKYV